MTSSFRRFAKSKVGTFIIALIGVLILVGFAMGDIQNVMSGGGFSGGSDTLVKIGSEKVSDREMSRAMDRRLSQVRQENPEASFATIVGDFDQLLAALVDAKTLESFADKFGMTLSRRLEDAQIANIPAARGLNGEFSEQSYRNFLNQQRITDEEVRMIVRNGLLQQLLIAPAVVNARAPIDMARPYASILLEARQGDVALVPTAAFRAGLNPTDADIQGFYAANQRRYMVPEQRILRIARIGPEQVASVEATDKDIADYYNANRAAYAPKETRVITQAVAADQATANAIANRIRGGQTFAAAAAPAGFSTQDIAVGPQTKAQFASLTTPQIANAAFAAPSGGLVGPIQSPNGWHVVKIDGIRREGGKSLAEARGEIATRLSDDKKKEALEALVDTVQNALDEGSSFAEAAAAAKLTSTETPLIVANGSSRVVPGFRLPPELAPALKTGFELSESDSPLVDSLPNDGGYVMVAPARIVAAAPAPLASIRDRVAADWVNDQASKRAQQLAQGIAAKAGPSTLAEAAKGTPVPVRVEAVGARRIQLSQFKGNIPAPIAMLFSLGEGKARMVAGPQGEGFYIIKVNRIIPGNALNQPSLIVQTQQQMQDALSQEYGAQFLNSMRQRVGVTRNEKAIAAAKNRIAGAGI